MDGMKTDIADIKLKLSLVNEVNNELEIQNRVKSELEKLKNNTIKEDEIKSDKRKFSWTKFSIIIASLIFVVGTLFQVLNYFNSKKAKEEIMVTKDKVDELGSPVVINPRGDFVPLPDGFTLKMWPNDFDKGIEDTIK
jgi:hypothetical protein